MTKNVLSQVAFTMIFAKFGSGYSADRVNHANLFFVPIICNILMLGTSGKFNLGILVND